MKLSVVGIVAGLLMILSGCSNHSTAPTATSDIQANVPTSTQDILLQYGASDDGTMAAASAICMDSLRVLLADTSLDVYSIAVIWGIVNPTVPPMPPIPLLDWSGAIGVNAAGFLKVVSLIDFEKGQDSLVPTAVPTVRAWVSHTGWDIDGLSMVLALKRGVVYAVPPEMKLKTVQTALTVSIDRLDKFDTLLAVDALNAMVVHARKLEHKVCPFGKVAGLWTRDDSTRAFGHFEGKWMNDAGIPTGKILGKFWSEPDFNKFAGDFTDSTGTIIGHVKGAWKYDDPMMCATCGTRMGVFDGRILDLDGNVTGEVHGRFGVMSSPMDTPALPFMGMWRTFCPEDAETNTNMAAN